MINKVTLIGNLGKDPEVKHLEGGSAVARIVLATNENYRDRNGDWQTVTEWHNVVVWGPMVESVERYYKKGNLVYVEGKLTTRKWTDKDNNDRYTTEVRANTLKLLEKRESNDQLSSGGYQSQEMSSQAPANKTPHATDMSANMDEDDLPF